MFNQTGKMMPFFMTATLLTVIFIFFIIVSFVRLKNRHIRKEHELLRALIGERERTMYTISVEIHDNINQMLVLASMALKMGGKYAVAAQEKYLAESGHMLEKAITDLRKISHSLNSSYLKSRGLQEALEEEVKWINITRQPECTLDVEGELRTLDQDTELMLIRIAQESIQNTLKHANAGTLSICLCYAPDLFSMSLKDNGTGFSVNTDMPWVGVGLQSIYERSRIINSHIEIRSEPGSGTEILLTIPNPRYIETDETGGSDAPDF